jgi:GT2 family glycosyltransferase
VWRQVSGPPQPPPPADAITGEVVVPVLIVPTLCRPELLTRLLSTLDVRVGHLVVIDNGRYWPRNARLPALSCRAADKLTVIELPSNLGVAGSWNLGIKSTPFAPWWAVCNDDVAWPPGSLAKLASVSGPGVLAAVRGFAAFTVGEDVVRKVGLFDERIHPAYYEDDDYCRRAAAAGVELTKVDVPLHHDGSASLGVSGGRAEGTSKANREFYAAKESANDLTAGWDIDRRRALAWDS